MKLIVPKVPDPFGQNQIFPMNIEVYKPYGLKNRFLFSFMAQTMPIANRAPGSSFLPVRQAAGPMSFKDIMKWVLTWRSDEVLMPIKNP